MKYPITTLLTITLMVTLFAASQLQAGPDRGRHHGRPDAEMRVAHMSSALGLSDEQSAQLLELFQAVDEERRALHEQTMERMKPQFCELQLATHAELERILDEEQLAQLEEMKASRESDNDRRRSRGKHDLDCSEIE